MCVQMILNRIVIAIVIVGLGISTPVSLQAQVSGGTLSGTVTDPSGAVIPNAQLAVRNTATDLTRTLISDADGFYTAPNLLPGTYEVTVTAAGFATEVRSGITLTVGAQQALNVTMRVGATTEKVQVTGEAPAVQLATSSLSAVVNATTVRELPLNGRSWTDLATLQPGVNAIQTQPTFATGGDRGNRGFGAEITISGVRPQSNNYRLDGISINDYSNGAPGSVLGGNLGVDAIQEFSVLTSNYSAEYGKTAGGVVNAITKSGTNQFHGDAYEFLRNSSLDARNFFDQAIIPPFRRNQFGGSAGGPVRKDRTFVFGDFEAVRQSKGITNTDVVPSPAARAGNLCSAPPSDGSCTPNTIVVDSSAAKYLPLYPLPNGALVSNGDKGIYSFAGQQVVNENFLTSRVDHKISEKDSLFGTYLYDDTDYHDPDGLGNQLVGSHTNRQIIVLEESHIFSPAFVNTVRGGYNRDGVANNHSVSAINPLASDPSLGALPGRNASDVRISGITELLGGLGSLSTYYYGWNSFQGYDDAFLTHGTHSIKFGGAFERMELNMLGLSNPSGVWNFGSLTNFLRNEPKAFKTGFASSVSPRGYRESLFGAYLQDDWRVRPNLTLNVGLRYEMTTVMSEVQGKITSLIHLTDSAPHLGSPLILNPTLRNFEPRLGFSWDPFRNGKTAIRGGFGIFDVLPLPYQFENADVTSAPFFLAGNTSNLPQGSFYIGAVRLLGVSSLQVASFEHQPKRDYVMQWNMNLQRELAPNLTATVGYVGSHGVHQPFRQEEYDDVMPTITPAGFLFHSPVGKGTTLNPAFGSIRGILYNNNSSFNALEVGVQKRMSHGLQAQGSFTWGKSMDDHSGSVAGDQFANSIAAVWSWFDPKASHGVSDFDIGKTFVANLTWNIPSLKSLSGPAGWITSGWQLGGIFTASDGVPFTPTFGSDGDPLGLKGAHPTDYPDRLTGPGCGSGVNPGNPNAYIKSQCFSVPTAPSAAFYAANCDPKFGTRPQCFNLGGNAGRNSLIGPGLVNLDFSVFKNSPIRKISDTFNVQFRAEVFNILNRPNFLAPTDNTDVFDASGSPTGVAGLVDATSTTAREIQFALKLIW
jgi:Carboxypeptidase regulatory-like domain/TonB dependent receptor-like, beta-barrel/TonB-dependent Receptor Plug Domain